MTKSITIKIGVLYFSFICLSLFSTLQAKTIYVAPEGKTYSGSKMSSSYNEPINFSSIFVNTSSMPSSFLQQGDTIYFKGGKYILDKTITLVQKKSSGVSDKRTVLKAYPGEMPVFDFHKLPYGREVTNDDNVGFSVPASYVDMIGLRICNAGKNGMVVTGSDNLIENCAFYGNGDSGLQMKFGGNNLIKNCDSYNNFDYKLVKKGEPDYGQNADGFADKQYTSPEGTANTYIGCRSWNNSDDGWDFYQRISSGAPTILQHCWCIGIAPTEYDMTNHPRYETDKEFFDQFKTAEGRIVVPNYGNGNGFKIGGAKTNHYVKLVNCVAVDNKIAGFDQNSDAGKMIVSNCLAYKNGINYSLGRKVAGATLDIKNCVSFSGNRKDVFQVGAQISDTQQSNNTWNLDITPVDTDFESMDISLAKSLRNPDGSFSAEMNKLFRLSPGSQLIDKGIDIGSPFCGQSPDLGAFEYGDGNR